MSGDASDVRLDRRRLLTALTVAGVVGGAGSTAIGAARRGCGMREEFPHLRLEWYRGSGNELPEPGVTDRIVYVSEDGDEYREGDVLRDTGTAWVPLEFGSESAGDWWRETDDGALEPADKRPVALADPVRIGNRSVLREGETANGEPFSEIAFDPRSQP
jgi:hypothetical protein